MSCNQKKKQRCPFLLMLQDGGCLPVEDNHDDNKAQTPASTDDGTMSATTNADTMPATTVQKSVSFSTTHPRPHQEQLQLPEAGGDKVRQCLEKHADTIYSLSSRSSLEYTAAAGVEYELNDYQLLNDVEDLHSWRSLSLRDDEGSESFEEELISIASDLVDESTTDGSRYSVYNNFDELFETASLLASESYERIRDSWTEVKVSPSRGSAAAEALDEHVHVDDHSGADREATKIEDLMSFPGDISIKSRDKQQRGEDDTSTIIKDENNQLLKNLVIKCLVRNIEKQDGKGLARDPSSTNYDDLASWSQEELNKLRLPRDPSTLSTSGSKSSYHSQRSKGSGISRQSQGRSLRRDPSMHHVESIDSRNDDNSAGVQQRRRKLMDPPENGVAMLQVSSSQCQRQLGEPSVVNFHQRKPASISHHRQQHVHDPSMVNSVYHQHQMVHQFREEPSHPYHGHVVAAQPSTSELSSRHNIMQHQLQVNGPPRPDVPRYSSNDSISGSTPGHYSVQSLSGQSILRRKRYKEMLLKQRAGLVGY